MARIKLTERQAKIAQLVAQGYTNREIAEILGTSPQVVAQQVRNLAFKFRLDPTRSYRIQIAQVVWELGKRVQEQETV